MTEFRLTFHRFQNVAGFLVAFFLFAGNLSADEEKVLDTPTPENAPAETSDHTMIPIQVAAADEKNGIADIAVSEVHNVRQQLVSKTQEVIDYITSGNVTVTEHAVAFDSFLSETFYRIHDSWVLCKHELLLAQEAANEEAKQLQQKVQQKVQDKMSEIPPPGIPSVSISR